MWGLLFWVPHLKIRILFLFYLFSWLWLLIFNQRYQWAGVLLKDAQTERTQKTMLYAMPIFIGWMSTKFPAGLCLYWIFYGLTGMIQQIFVNRRPEFRKGGVGKVNE